ncbi:CHASE domain-containing protein [Qipengyuania gaetbuli]|uniref:CHASE domain-containing protein n=1 Tax=Qipengyuania gaetbuli TaxID=266952 RepID=UPI001CD64715|nr:CHASE domain-containing protein [Qipengyuania gaetbuli]MCA0910578.1 CHASE domain-containing protein [Qipengyuania gaetbuli]
MSLRGRMLEENRILRRGRRRRWLVDYPRMVPLAIFLLVAAVTFVSVVAIESGQAVREEAELNRKAQSMVSAIERRAYSNSAFLRAAAALFSSQGEVSSDSFRQFVTELRLDADYRGAEGIGWAPAISSSEIVKTEDLLSDGRVSRVRITPSIVDQPRSQLVPVLYLQPDTLRNRRALGFDMYSEPVRREALDEATKTARPTATGHVVLVQEGGVEEPGFLIYMPVFDGGITDRVLKGFVYSPFNAGEFLASAADLVGDDETGVRLYDIGADKRDLMAELPGWKQDVPSVEREIDLANRKMLLVVQSSAADVLSPLSMITLLFGLAVASLLLVVARLLTQQAQEDSRSLEWFAEQNSIRNSLTRELNHRVKNTLANVLSIVSLTRRRADNLDEFAQGIDSRIRALSATHDLLTQSEWGTTPIRSVIEVELAPYANAEDHTVVMEGPDVELAPNDALSMGLAIHELATNAAKFGALSRAGGKVTVIWTLVNEGLARIDWSESGGPRVTEPQKRGFGTDLIEKIVAHELRHPVELEFLPTGVRCKLLVPVREPNEFMLRSAPPPQKGH